MNLNDNNNKLPQINQDSLNIFLIFNEVVNFKRIILFSTLIGVFLSLLLYFYQKENYIKS